MRLRKHRPKAFGLNLIVALSVLALGAASAQASGEFELLDSGQLKTFLQHGITSESATVHLDTALGAILSVAGLGFELKCTAVIASGLTVQAHGLLLGRLLYTGCTALESSALLHELPCSVSDKGGHEQLGKILTNLIHGLLFLHGTKNYILVKPDPPATSFANLVLKGAECPISGLYEVAGTQMLEVKPGHGLGLLVTPIFNSTLFPLITHPKIKFGERNATLSGPAEVLLAGSLAGKEWGAVP